MGYGIGGAAVSEEIGEDCADGHAGVIEKTDNGAERGQDGKSGADGFAGVMEKMSEIAESGGFWKGGADGIRRIGGGEVREAVSGRWT